MLDEAAIKNMFKQVHDLWIKPELDRRWSATGIPAGFKIYRCLVRLPAGQPAIVQFNEEVGWVAETRMVNDRPLVPGDDVFLHDVERVKTVQPPEVDGKRVAFVFLYYAGNSYSLIFDFSPNSADGEDNTPDDWAFGEAIAEYLQAVLVERSVNIPPATIEQL